MSNFYSDSKFGVIQRTWFGLTTKVGGEAASGITLGTKGTTTAITTPTRWYPKGPIRLVKAGFRVLATVANASSGVKPLKIFTRGASASSAVTITPSSCTIAQYAVASSTTFTVAQCKAGEYLSMKFGTAQTVTNATEVQATTSGTVAIFVDWVPTFDAGGKWNA